MKFILPSLMENIDCMNSELRVESLKILSELSNLFFSNQNEFITQDLKEDLKFAIETQFFDM